MLVFTHPSRLVTKTDGDFESITSLQFQFVISETYRSTGRSEKLDGSQFCTFWNAPDEGGIQVPLLKGNDLEKYRRENGLQP